MPRPRLQPLTLAWAATPLYSPNCKFHPDTEHTKSKPALKPKSTTNHAPQ